MTVDSLVTPNQPISVTPPVLASKKSTLRKLSSSDRQKLRRESGIDLLLSLDL